MYVGTGTSYLNRSYSPALYGGQADMESMLPVASYSTNAYLNTLQQEYADLNITAQAAAPKMGMGNVSIAPNILREMANDPQAAARYKAILASLPAIETRLANQFRADGMVLQSHSWSIDASGKLSSWGIIRVEAAQGSASDNTPRKKRVNTYAYVKDLVEKQAIARATYRRPSSTNLIDEYV